METHQRQVRLLPNYFKKIGIGVILFAALIFIPAELSLRQDQSVSNRQLFQVISLDLLIAGMVVYCLAKDRVEDELIALLRMQSVAFAFLLGVFNVIIQP